MKKWLIIVGTVALTAGMIAAVIISKRKKKKCQLKEPLESGLYTIDVFKKITCDMNNAIAETEKRLAEHDEKQKMYDEMQWNASNN